MASVNFLVLTSLIASGTFAGTCQYIKAPAGDGCYQLAQLCDISQTQLQQYNPQPNFCTTVQAGQYVCCSSGSLPNFAPKPYANGTCYTYTVKKGDTCTSIAQANQMNETSINGYNKETWAWTGCGDLLAYQNICLSSGTPPFPAPVANTVCGPQVPGTTEPAGMNPKNWTNLNPCPLNACCDKWGQCGITSDFCTESSAITGAPGTSAEGQNGCISNCGTKIVFNSVPNGYKNTRIGYFEAWNEQRPCLWMDISELSNNTYYDHVHWAFANLSTSWEPDVSGFEKQFEGLKNLTNMKKILSFGGWSFSTTAYTFNIFRSGVLPANQQTFATNVVNFIVQNDLDGVDFDWEYPGEPDIPGIPPDSTASGANYLAFLKLVRAQLPASKTLSIAAPASYWYLRAFPIKEISEVVSYIVYMTYDLHGQWDWNNTFADPGCPTGGCLRSQVNLTEVEYALAMITKAGVPVNKIIVGLPLYGRSFGMSNPACYGPECHFTGPASGATPGVCTQTAGYISNYEIISIIDQANDPSMYPNVTVQQYYFEGDVMLYGDNYVSWMQPSTYHLRQAIFDEQGFGGTSDWAIDLNQTYVNGNGSLVGFGQENFTVCDYSISFDNLKDMYRAQSPDPVEGIVSNWPTYCNAAIALGTLINMLNATYANYTVVNQGYDALFGYYEQYIEELVPNILQNAFIFNISTPWNPASGYHDPPMGSPMINFNCQLGGGGPLISCADLNKTQYEGLARTHTTNMIVTNETGYQVALVNAGLSPDWVTFGDFTFTEVWITGEHTSGTAKFAFSNAPIKNSSMVVPNPKNLITQGLGNVPGLLLDMQATLDDIILGQWFNGSTSDPVSVYSVAVFTMMSAVDSMAQAKQIAQQQKKIDQEERVSFILNIVSAVLIVVPVIGDFGAAAVGVEALGRVISIASDATNVAIDIYNTVQNPKSGIVSILGALFGVGSIVKTARDGPGLAELAEIREDISADEIASLGDVFKENDEELSNVMGRCPY